MTSFTASAASYNTGSAMGTSIDLSSHTSGSPTAYALGSATSAHGGAISVNAAGIASYTSPVGYRGSDSFTFTASNSSGASSPAATVTVPISDPTLAISLTGSGASQGSALSGYAITSTGGKSPYTCNATPASGSLPSGVTLSGACALSGTPTGSGTSTFTVSVTDNSTGTGPVTQTSGTLSLSVTAVTVAVTSGVPSGAQVGANFSQTNAALGGATPYTYALASGALPAGTSLNSATGVVSGTPTAAGPFSYAVKASDGHATPISGAGSTVSGTIAQAANVISFTGPGATSLSPSPISVGATASSGLGVTFSSTTTSVCTISGLTVSLLTTGNCTIVASQAGNANVATATPVSQTFNVSANAQTVAFTSTPPSSPNIGGAYAVATSGGGSGNPVILSLDAASSGCSLSGSTVTFTAAGTCKIDANQAGNVSYAAAAQAQQSIVVGKNAQAITFTSTAPSSPTIGGSYAVSALGGASGIAVTFNLDAASSGCSLSGSTVTFTGAGVCKIDANQAGDARYTAAAQVQQSITIGQAAQVIAFTSTPPSSPSIGASYIVAATGGASGNPVTFSVDAASTGCSLSASTVTFTGPGTCKIDANQAGGTSYAAAPQVQQRIVVGQTTQTISFTKPAATPLSGSPVTLTATASSGLGVSYASNVPGVCAVLGSSVTLVTAGTCSITASQAGNATYAAAAPVTQIFAVGTNAQAINFPTLAAAPLSGSPVTLAATASSGLAVSYASSTPATCTISGNTAVLVATGMCTVSASQSGDATYAAATSVSRSFTIGANGQSISFNAPSATPVAGSPMSLVANASSGLPITFSSTTPSICTVSGAAAILVSAGTCTITASQAGDATFSAAAPVTQSFGVTANPQTINFAAPVATVLLGSPVTLTATASSNLPVSYTSNSPTICTVSGSSVALVSAGTCSITASQAGNATFSAATPATVIFGVNTNGQTITFPAPTSGTLGAGTVTLAATASSGLPVSYASTTPATCAVSGNAVTLVAAGACSITAGQSGNATFSAAAPVTQSFGVGYPKPVAGADTATTPANQAVTIAVTANDAGPITSIVVAQGPVHGTAVVQALGVVYTPTLNVFGSDTFSYTATGPGGVSAPAVVTVTVTPLAVPAVPAPLTGTVLAGQPLVLHPTATATGGPFTAVAITTPSPLGTAVVTGLDITFTPTATSSGTTTIGFTVANPFGTSQEASATITVQPLPVPAAAPKVATVVQGNSASVDLTAGATGGPFTGATLVSVSPADAGTATLLDSGTVISTLSSTSPAASGHTYTLNFVPKPIFSGTVTITYTLSNAYAVSAQGLVTLAFQARPDPSQDPTVTGLLNAQADTARRLARNQLQNFNERLEQLHTRDGGAGVHQGIKLSGGSGGSDRLEPGISPLQRRDSAQAMAYIDAARGFDPGRQAPAAIGSRPGLLGAKTGSASKLGSSQGSGSGSNSDPDSSGSSGDPPQPPKQWGVWANGAVGFGERDSQLGRHGFRFTVTGISAGVDYRFSDVLTAGVGGGYGQDLNRVGKDGTKLFATTAVGAAYASFHPHPKLYVDGVIGYGDLDYALSRYSTPALAMTHATRKGDELFGSITAAWDMRRGPVRLSPYGRWDAATASLDAYTETGGGIYALAYRRQTVQTSTGSFGLKADTLIRASYGVWAPKVRLEFSHDFQKAAAQDILYADMLSGPVYSAKGDAFARDRITLGLGTDWRISDALTFNTEYRVEAGDKQTAHGIEVKGDLKF